MKGLISLILITWLASGCVITATRKGNKMTLDGWGAKGATWEKDGEKYSISKTEPISVPDLTLKE